MKIKNTLLSCFLLTLTFGMVHQAAAENIAGPNGGRLLTTEPPAEFFVNKDKKIEITFLGAEQKALPLEERTVRIIAQNPEGREILETENEKTKIVSKKPIPEGDGYTIVVQIYNTPDARPQNFRIPYQAHICGGCDLQEYACICDH